MREGEGYVLGDNYTVWCVLLYSHWWFRLLGAVPTVKVTVPLRYCTSCHSIKKSCAAPLYKKKGNQYGMWMESNTSAPEPPPSSGTQDGILHDVQRAGIILFTCWNTGWSITLSKKGRWWVAEVTPQQVINKHPWKQTLRTHRTHFLCSTAKW